ncbi:hypothetical protein GCM10010272_31030 [Streptomyces lateritius]|nr:hypothetical protein GCM10010272_31030 [Streptomyces lateritius]
MIRKNGLAGLLLPTPASSATHPVRAPPPAEDHQPDRRRGEKQATATRYGRRHSRAAGAIFFTSHFPRGVRLYGQPGAVRASPAAAAHRQKRHYGAPGRLELDVATTRHARAARLQRRMSLLAI